MQRAETCAVRSGVADGELGLAEAMRAKAFMGLVDVNLTMRVDP